MKHADLLTEKDRRDLEVAEEMVKGGKMLRKLVFARLRARAFRRGKADV
jgi:hypothetical protein